MVSLDLLRIARLFGYATEPGTLSCGDSNGSAVYAIFVLFNRGCLAVVRHFVSSSCHEHCSAGWHRPRNSSHWLADVLQFGFQRSKSVDLDRRTWRHVVFDFSICKCVDVPCPPTGPDSSRAIRLDRTSSRALCRRSMVPAQGPFG